MSALPLGAFPPSELILTPHGTVYHLDLHPDALASTVLTVGDPGRVAEVSKHFDTVEHKAAHREFVSHTGRIGAKRFTVIGTGIGPDNIDIVLNEVDALANIDFDTRMPKAQKTSLQILRLGTSGGLRADVPLDGLVVSSFGIGLDNLMHFYPYEPNPDETFILNEFIGHVSLHGRPVHPYIAEGSIRLRNLFGDHEFYHGITVTCPGFYAPQGRALRGGLSMPGLVRSLGTFESRGHRITNFEMETSAIYGLGKLLGHQCCSVNTIVAQRIEQKFSSDPAAAVERMIVRVLDTLSW